MELSETDKAYAAGLVDGEGCVSSYYNSGVFEVRVVIAMTALGVIEWLHSTFGGDLRLKQVRNTNHKQVYIWQLRAKECIPFLEAVLPYLKLKAKQAEIVMAMANTIEVRGKHIDSKTSLLRFKLNDSLSELNKRGA